MIEGWVYSLGELYQPNTPWTRGLVSEIHGLLEIPTRLGRMYVKAWRSIEDLQWCMHEGLQDWRGFELSNLLRHVCDDLPCYVRVFGRRRLKREDIQRRRRRRI